MRFVRKEHQLALRFDMRALAVLEIRHPINFIRRKSVQRAPQIAARRVTMLLSFPKK
jgi:hypothetical protein